MKKIECRHNNLYSYIQTTFVSLYTSTLYKADKSLILEHSWVNDVRHKDDAKTAQCFTAESRDVSINAE